MSDSLLLFLGLAAMVLFSVSFCAAVALEQRRPGNPAYGLIRGLQRGTGIMTIVCICLFWVAMLVTLIVEVRHMLENLTTVTPYVSAYCNSVWWF